jgi:hypothetical protein
MSCRLLIERLAPLARAAVRIFLSNRGMISVGECCTDHQLFNAPAVRARYPVGTPSPKYLQLGSRNIRIILLFFNRANEASFEDLQALNRVHLVVPFGADHMYDAAVQSQACRLTQSGRYYWRLAKNGRI